MIEESQISTRKLRMNTEQNQQRQRRRDGEG